MRGDCPSRSLNAADEGRFPTGYDFCVVLRPDVDLRPATMPTTAPATLPARDATPLATLVAPLTSELAGPLALEDFEDAEPALDVAGLFFAALAVDFGAELEVAPDVDLAALALGLAAVDVLADLVDADLADCDDAFFAVAAGLASFERSAMAAPAPVFVSIAFEPEGFFVEAALLM